MHKRISYFLHFKRYKPNRFRYVLRNFRLSPVQAQDLDRALNARNSAE